MPACRRAPPGCSAISDSKADANEELRLSIRAQCCCEPKSSIATNHDECDGTTLALL
jgi:hypothetical protein